MDRHLRIPVVLAITLAVGPAALAAQAQLPTRSITQITPNLYRAQNNAHFNVFLVTPEGIILTDPISREFSTWLKGELESRFNVPVRYVIYTHHHWDHASGGEVFAETAQFIGHDNLPGYLALSDSNGPLAPGVRQLDANRNGRVERSEANQALLGQFDLTDENGDGALSAAELVRGPLNDVYAPTITFSDRHTVTLGGKTVMVVHAGTAHSRDMSVILFPQERVLFGADLLQVRRLPQGVDPTVGEWIDAYEVVNSLDFDTIVPGHGVPGTNADLLAFGQYLEEIAEAVAAGVARGQTLEEIRSSIRLDTYREWERYDQMLPVHIDQIFRILKGVP